MSQTIAARRATNPAAAVAAGDLIPMAQGGIGVVGLASELLTYVQANLTGFAILGANTFTALQTITQATANAGILASTGYSLTGSNATSMLSLAGTLNTSGNPVLFQISAINTASGATTKFLSFLAGAAGATEVFSVDKTGNIFCGSGTGTINAGSIVTLASVLQANNSTGEVTVHGSFGLSFGSSALLTPDVFIRRDAANTLALRNSTNAQTFNVYDTFTDASNYERLFIGFTSSVAYVSTRHAGTGASNQSLKLNGDGGIFFATTDDTNRWILNASGHFLANVDNTYDIGASGATRPRNVFIATHLTAGGTLNAGAAAFVGFTGRSYIDSPSDGVLRIADNAGTSFSRLQFGGTTSGFGGVARDGAGLRIVTADSNTAHSFLDVSELRVATTKVLGARRTGWSAATGGATRTTFDTATVTLPQLAERVKALLDDFLVHGALGA